MKKVICLLAVLFMTAPVLAQTEVWISGEDMGGGQLKLSYYVVGEDALRGIALNISCAGGATIDSGADAMVPGGSEMNTFLDYIYDNPDGYDVGMGNPLAKVDGPGQPTGPAPDFSVCLGMLDQSGNQGGAAAGSQGSPIELCTLQLNGNGAESTDVTVSGDDLRGGAVGSTITIIVDLDNDGTPDTTITVSTSVGPACWNFPKFSCGDSSGDGTIDLTDFNVLAAAFNTVQGNAAYDECADYSKDAAVSLADFNMLAAFFNTTPAAASCP